MFDRVDELHEKMLRWNRDFHGRMDTECLFNSIRLSAILLQNLIRDLIRDSARYYCKSQVSRPVYNELLGRTEYRHWFGQEPNKLIPSRHCWRRGQW